MSGVMDSGISLYKELKEKIGEKEAEHLVEYIKSATRDKEIFERFNEIDKRFDAVDLRFDELHNLIISVRTELKQEAADLRTELKGDIAELRAEFKHDITLIYKAISDNNKWLISLIFALWLIGTLSIIITIFLK